MIDVYRKKFPAEQSLLKLGTYLTMFSQLLRPHRELRGSPGGAGETGAVGGGAGRGLAHADPGTGSEGCWWQTGSAFLWNDIQTIGFVSISTPVAWMGAFGYSLELYFDFAGYSMMAIGIGKMLGFAIPENFHFRICPNPLQSSGGGGTSRWAAGSGSMYISPWG